MQLNPKQIKNQFEKSMPSYNQNAIVQEIMAEKLITNIPQKNYKNILELGCGTGVLTDKIKKNISFSKYTANDLTNKSKKYLDKILSEYNFILGNAAKIKSSQKFDLIISNAMFQWFKNLENVTENYSKILEKNGILAFSTFTTGNFEEIKNITGLSLEYLSSEEIKNILLKNYEIIYKEDFTRTLEFSNPLELLAHMKYTGVNSISQTKWTFKDVKNFCDEYKTKYSTIKLTYSPAIFICKNSK